jgi:predicted transcriptional regulator
VRIGEDAPATEALNRMSANGFGRLVVVDPEGRMIGIITKTDLIRAIQVRLAALQGGSDGATVRPARLAHT